MPRYPGQGEKNIRSIIQDELIQRITRSGLGIVKTKLRGGRPVQDAVDTTRDSSSGAALGRLASSKTHITNLYNNRQK